MPETDQTDTTIMENSPDPVEETRKIPNLSTLDDLRDLSAGSQIEVTRLTPSAIKGFCGHLVVPDGGMTDVLEEIQSTHGGGKYQLRGKCLSPNGRLVYAQGTVQVDVAGYPVFQGKEYVNGVWRAVAVPAAAPAAMTLPNPGRQIGSQGMESMLGGFVQTALQGALNSEGGINMGELPALITSIAALSGGAEKRDSFSDLERSMSILAKLNESRPEPAPAPASDDMGGLTALLPMLMQKFSQPQQPPQPQYAPPHPQYASPPPGYGPQPQRPPVYQPYGAVSSEQMWANMHQQPPAGPHPYPQQAQPPSQGNWTNDPRSPQASGAPGVPPQASPPAAPVPPVGQPQGLDPEETYEPLSVDDVMQDLADRDPAGQAQFIGEFCQALGIDKAMVESMFPDGPPGPPNAGAASGFTLDLPNT